MNKKRETRKKTKSEKGSILKIRSKKNLRSTNKREVHIYCKNQECNTESMGYETPKNQNPLEIVLDASEGFIPLWAKNVNLRWRFNPYALHYFDEQESLKDSVRELFRTALIKWGAAVPIRFTEHDDAWDFEIVLKHSNYGNVLASAFFPDSGRHQLIIYPKMFEQSYLEQIDTMLHELGHVFGLRHFFSKIRETEWPAEIYGEHKSFSIMNYGPESKLTEADKRDLAMLYAEVWSGKRQSINGTPITLVRPYHELGLNCKKL